MNGKLGLQLSNRLHEPAPDEVEGLLCGPLADAVAVAAEGALDGFVFLGVGEGDVDQANGFGFCCAGRNGDAGDAEAEGGTGAETDSFGEGLRNFSGDGAVPGDELGRDIGEGGLEGVRVDDCAAKEGAGAAGDRGDALGDHAAGAAFGDGEGGLAEAEEKNDDLLERLAVRGVEPVFKGLFHAAGELVNALLGGGGVGLGAEEGDLDVASVGQDGGFDVGVGSVDGGEELVGLGLGDHGSLEGAPGDVARGQDLAQAGQALGVKEGAALVGRAGDEQDELAVTGEGDVEPLAGGGAVGVGQDGGAFEYVGLLEVVVGDGDAHGGGEARHTPSQPLVA